MIEQPAPMGGILQEGTIIQYRLLPAERPAQPNRIWHGKVLKAWIGMHFILDCCRVESLEQGYEGFTELVLISQIIKIERCTYSEEN
jgi:hypothetical protein